MVNDREDLIMVSGGSSVKKVATYLAKTIEEKGNGEVELRAMGASAVNQLCKAVAIARGMLAVQGHDLCLRLGFCEANVGEERRTAIRAIASIKG